MTESLRERCIEAGAESVRFAMVPGEHVYVAAQVLDAVLDVLEESADEWSHKAAIGPSEMVVGLLAVLRGNGE